MHCSNNITCSALMACRNASKFVIDSLDSFVKQDFEHKDMVIVDDFSDDSSTYLIEKYIEEKDLGKTIKLIKLNRQLGCAGARNVGLSHSSGKYIAIWDADDVYEFNRISMTINYMIKNNLDACGTWANVINENGETTNNYDYSPVEHEDICWMLPSKINPMIDPSCVIKKQSIIIAGYWATDPKIELAPDLDLWFKMQKSSMRIGNLPKRLMSYRIQPNSNTVSKKTDMIRHHVEVVKRHYGKVELNRHEKYAKV